MKKVHLICNAHIDPIWQWGWDEGISSVISTFKSAIDMADEFDYIFCHGESLLYEVVEKNAPELFSRIKELVRSGKWHISGGWYLQPDCLMPSGETLIRNIAEGRRFFKEKFGVLPTVATNYDSFGHSVGLAQILKKCGFNGYLICRPKKDAQIKYPSRFFKWTAPDGSSVIVSNSATYNSPLGEVKTKIKRELEELNEVDYILWGVGNHGGGPSRKDLKDIKGFSISGVSLVHSTPEDLFSDKIEVKGELNRSLVTCMPGCYSSMARIKQAFRRVENLFYATEKMLAVACLNGFDYDRTALKQAEKRLVLSTFHDILPGTCIADGEQEGLGLLYAAERTLKDLRTEAFSHLTYNFEKAGEGEYPIFVFNYLPYEKESVLEVEFSLADQNWSEDVVFSPHIFDEEGNELPCQQIKENSTLNLDWRKRIAFRGKLKPLSITRFAVKVSAEKKANDTTKDVDVSKIISLGGYLTSPATLETYCDTADPWGMSEKELKNMGETPAEFIALKGEKAARFCGVDGRISPERIVEDGKLFILVESLKTNGTSNAVVYHKFYKDDKTVDIKVVLEFFDKNKLIKLKIPVPSEFKDGTLVGDGPYVWEEKPNTEVCYQKWLGVKKGNKIFSISNDGTYGGSFDGENIYITLIRGAGYCFHPIENRDLYPKNRYLPRIDCGRYEYDFRVSVGDIYSTVKSAEEFNTPPYALNVFPTGSGEKGFNGVELKGNAILSSVRSISAFKYELRLYNPNDKKEDFSLSFGETKVSGEIGKAEIITVLLEKGRAKVKNEIL